MITMWARVENGTVAELTDIDPAGRFHPSMQWRPVGHASDCGLGWVWDDEACSAPAPLLPSAEELCQQIDVAADAARCRVAGDPLRSVEYDLARLEAQAFADAGYPSDAVPRSVAAWAINGRSARQAADSILAKAAAFTEALYQIREARLKAKEQIRHAIEAGNTQLAQDIATEFSATYAGFVKVAT